MDYQVDALAEAIVFVENGKTIQPSDLEYAKELVEYLNECGWRIMRSAAVETTSTPAHEGPIQRALGITGD